MVDETALAIPQRQESRGITIVGFQRNFIFDNLFNSYWSKWQTKHSKLAAKEYETSEFHQDMWNRYLMLECASSHIPWSAISYLELRWSYKAIHSDQVLLSARTIIKTCRRDFALSVDASRKQLSSWNQVSLALDGWTSTNKLAITPVIPYYIDQNWALCHVQLAFDEVDHLFFSGFKSQLRMIGQWPTYWSKASCEFEGRAWSFWCYRWLFSKNYYG